MRKFFIPRNRFEEVDEGLVFRSGTYTHPIQFIGVQGLKSARDFGQVLCSISIYKSAPNESNSAQMPGENLRGGALVIFRVDLSVCQRGIWDRSIDKASGSDRHPRYP